MAASLMLKGFVLQGMDKNQSNKRKNIFYFKDSHELQDAMKEISVKK